MNDTSNVGNAKSAGRRLRPFEIATMLIPLAGGKTARVMDATDEQFQSFIKGASVPVDEQGIAEWSFDDRCGIINHALKYGLQLPFVEQFVNNSSPELLPRPKLAPQAWIEALDAYPFLPVVPSGGRDYPDLEEGENDV